MSKGADKLAGYSHKTWACPFFHWDERLCVRCEGGCMSFQDREALAEYADRYCANLQDWKSCTVAANLLKYYERTE